MKSTRAQAALNKDKVLELGSRLFREHGYNGVGVADLMRQAGQTHGAFYGHFGSKDQFQAEASSKGFAQMLDSWRDAALRLSHGDESQIFEGLVSAYLSEAHRDNPALGCMAAALGSEAGRLHGDVRAAMSQGVEGILGLLATASGAKDPRTKRGHAVRTFASLVGALIVARAVGDGALSREMLDTTAAGVLRAASGTRPEQA